MVFPVDEAFQVAGSATVMMPEPSKASFKLCENQTEKVLQSLLEVGADMIDKN